MDLNRELFKVPKKLYVYLVLLDFSVLGRLLLIRESFCFSMYVGSSVDVTIVPLLSISVKNYVLRIAAHVQLKFQ